MTTPTKRLGASGLVLEEELIFEKSRPGRQGYLLPPLDVPTAEIQELLPAKYVRNEVENLPELSEVDVVRHFTRLSHLNYSVDFGFYPLGSCTMKYNPRVNEAVAGMNGFSMAHPLLPASAVQGNLTIMAELEQYLAEIGGFDAVSLQPAAGAHGELTGMLVIKAYHTHRKDYQRDTVLIPNSAHGTNPASSAICGYSVLELTTDERGNLDLECLKAKLSDRVAALMITNPSTLGLFDEHIIEVVKLVHAAGGQVYCDGANLNALMGRTRPGDWGVDVLHFNLHKTFSTPHGGGGPGSGPIGVKAHLEQFLPVPRIVKQAKGYALTFERPASIGKISSFYGNFGVMLKAYTYIRTMGPQGLKHASDMAVLNANYIKTKLTPYYNLPYDRICKHEVVLNDKCQNQCSVKTMDIAKRLMDYGFHPPTVYFPLIVHGALMIEPTETESLDELNTFIEAMIAIAKESEQQPELLHEAPHLTFRSRLDETLAARKPILRWQPEVK